MRLSHAVAITTIVYTSLFLNFFLVGTFDCLSPRLAEANQISYQQLAVVTSIKSFVNMFCGPAFAFVSVKFPPRHIFSMGGLCLAGCMTGIAFSTNQMGFLISRALHGIGTAGLMVGGMTILLRSIEKHEKGRYASIAYSSVGHAALVAPVLSGLMYDHLGQMWTFLIIAILTYAVTIVSSIALSRIAIDQPASDFTPAEKLVIWPCVRSILQKPITYVALAGILSDGLSFGSCETTLPAALVDWGNGSLSVLTTSLIYTVGPIAFTIVVPIAGYVIDKTKHYKVMLFGLLLFTIVFPLFHIFTQSLAGLGACIGLSFAIAGTCEVAIYPFISEIAESTGIPHADTVGYAMNELFIHAGYALGDLAGRALVDWNGFFAMGMFMAGWDLLALAFASLVLLMIKRRNLSKSLSRDIEEKTVAFETTVS